MPNAASSGFELWKQAIDRASDDPRWRRHDCAVLSTIAIMGLVITTFTCKRALAQEPMTGERALRYECSTEPAGINECLTDKVSQSVTRLRDAHSFATRQLAAWDEDARYVKLARTRLAAADRSFENFKRAHCAFAASMGGGAVGHALETGRLACVADLNVRQADLIRSLVARLPPR